MPRACTVCTHADREAIDKALVAGEPAPRIAAKYRETSADSLLRHKADHLPGRLAKAQDAAETVQADNLLAQVRQLQTRAVGILDTAETAGDLRSAIMAIREARGCIELLAKLLGELDDRPQINVLLSPEWSTVRAALFEALQPYPDVREQVAGRLLALEASNGHRG